MKIVLTSDTHIPRKGKQLPAKLLKECETADIIIHAGDWSSMEVFHSLSHFAVVKGVYGNIDSDEVKEFFPFKDILDLNGFKLGIVHGHGENKTTEKRVLETFQNEDVDIIVFGHSHIPMVRYFKNTLLFNPGSPTDKRVLPYYSFGILDLDEVMRAELVYFHD